MTPELKTERLRLRPLTQDDQPWFGKLNRDPVVRRFLWDDDIISDEQAADIIAESSRLFEDRQYGLFRADDENGEPVGYYGLWFFFGEDLPQLLYVTDPERNKEGFAVEGARAIRDYAFGPLAFSHLDAACDAANEPSHQVARALGFKLRKTAMEEGLETTFYRAYPADDGAALASG
ncbi:GNAT family N-acetyltransferase [Parvularcula sp. ZS-1/3]|uniref:GNAT family N-acetyltransferase n=1 Tax=Parvularcula mediterranea TaxID=2732508 RepID=A0A7Y3W4C0_9PROT|nr:GNAT family protein [Parvularcula mediterranea]NNU15066.1 GNAT family N-acetyltransferase [Parvularcula mediterranea]